VKANPKLDFI